MATKLHRFEGRETIGTRIKITNAGDGLSKALAIEPEELVMGATVYVVLECEVDKIGHERVKDNPRAAVRVQTLKAGTATIVDKAMVAEVLEAQRLKIEQATGVERLDFPAADGAEGNGGGDGE